MITTVEAISTRTICRTCGCTLEETKRTTNGRAVLKVFKRRLAPCTCQLGGALKVIRDGFENRPGAKIHARTNPDRPARARKA